MNGSLWSSIDQASSWSVAPVAGLTDTSETPTAGQAVAQASVPFFHPNHPQWAFGLVVAGAAALLYMIYEGKGAGARASANLGPLDASVGGDVK